MAKRHKQHEQHGDAHDAGEMREGAGGEAHEMGDTVEMAGSGLKRMSRLARQRPVTTLALAAGVGALMGAELLAAGLAGGAAVLLLQRSDLRRRARRVMDSARERISEGVERIEHYEHRHA